MKHIVGIDLGYSNTICSYYDKGNIKQFSFGTTTILPTYIYEKYNLVDNSLTPEINKNIREFANNYDNHMIFGSKKLLGRDFYHPIVKKFVNSHIHEMKIVNKNGNPAYKLIYQVDDKLIEFYLSPEDVSAQILSYIREMYNQKIGHDIDSCVVTVPANFDNNQRRATISAIEKSGIKCLELINEPTASAFLYSSPNPTEKKTILIFDYGVETIDISIVETKGYEFEILYTEGNNDLGGRNLDKILYEAVLKKFTDKYGGIISSHSARILMLEVEHAKIELSKKENVAIILNFDDDEILNVTISRSEYESLIANEIEKNRKFLFDSIKESRVKPDTISAVFPIGATCRTPLVEQMLDNFFNKTRNSDKYYINFKNKVKIVKELSYEYSVSEGACKIAALLDSGGKISEKIHYNKLVNSVGILLQDDTPWWVFSSGTKFPAHQVSRIMNDPWKPSLELDIIEGSKGNTQISKIQTVRIDNIPMHATKLNLELSYNESGKLTVQCTDPNSDFNVSIRATNAYQPETPEIGQENQRSDFDNFDKRIKELLSAAEKAKNRTTKQNPYKKLIRDIRVIQTEAEQEFDSEYCTEVLKNLEATFRSYNNRI